MNQLPVNALLGTKYPLIQGGMIWCSGWRLASAVSNAGGLGTLGSGSMYPEVLDEQLTKVRAATEQPFAVNLPLLYPQVEDHFATIVKHRVPVVITSAGSPSKLTRRFQAEGIKVIHVVSSALFAKKAEDAGVDAVVAEGFEAGGHNGREETTTMVLIPSVVSAVSIPVIAAGGIASGAAAFAASALGASGWQLGSAFVATEESSAHPAFKAEVLKAKEGSTKLTLKELAPVRLLQNEFYHEVQAAYQRGATTDELRELLGRGRAKRGMFEGDLKTGELEIGQVSAQLNKLKSAAAVVDEIMEQYNALANAAWPRY